VPGIVVVRAGLGRYLVADPPGVARGRLDLDHVRAEVAEEHRGARAGDEARQVHHLQARKDVVRRHVWLLEWALAPVTGPGTVAPASGGTPPCLPSCLPCPRTGRSTRPRGRSLLPGSLRAPCSRRGARTRRPAARSRRSDAAPSPRARSAPRPERLR